MKNQDPYLLSILLLILSSILPSGASGQKTDSDTLSIFYGTWVGFTEKKGPTLDPLIWRIHKIDNDKKQIELTEIGYSLDGLELSKPKRSINQGTATKNALNITIVDSKGKPVELKLTIEYDGEIYSMSNSPNKNEGSLRFGKISSDASYVNPSPPAKVRFTAPPPAADSQ